jgi:acetyl-CoA carboxylase carboxyltransferase component
VLRQRLRLTETLFRDRIVTQNEVLALQQELSLILQDVSTAISERARVAAEQVELGRLAEQRVREAELALNEVTRRLERLTGGLNDTVIDANDAEGKALYATARLWDDGLIDPRDSRRVLAFCLATALDGDSRETHPITFGVGRM